MVWSFQNLVSTLCANLVSARQWYYRAMCRFSKWFYNWKECSAFEFEMCFGVIAYITSALCFVMLGWLHYTQLNIHIFLLYRILISIQTILESMPMHIGASMWIMCQFSEFLVWWLLLIQISRKSVPKDSTNTSNLIFLYERLVVFWRNFIEICSRGCN